jgi:hypothetical protein
VVGSAVHCADSIEASRQPISDVGGEKTLAVAVIVDTLEEIEDFRVGRAGGGESAAKILDGDVTVTDDLATLKSLRSRVVCALSIGKGTGDQVLELNLDGEGSVCGNVLSRAGEENYSGNHVLVGRNVAHSDAVAGAASHLFTVCQGLASANVDEVGIVANQSQYTIRRDAMECRITLTCRKPLYRLH